MDQSNNLHGSLVTTFAILRSLVGTGTLLAPSLSARFFGLSSSFDSRIYSRLFGVRELALGIMLWRAYSSGSSGMSTADPTSMKQQAMGSAADLSKLLWVGVFIDSVDAVSSALSIWEGSMGGRAIWLVGVGAAGFAGLGLLTLRTA